MKLNKQFRKKDEVWRVEKSHYIFNDRWLKVRADECVTEEGTKISPYYVLEYPDWVHMVVINKDNEILITRQYRHGIKKNGYELPCGTVDVSDKKPLDAAQRELLEKTGYSGNFILVDSVYPNPANHSNKIHIFLVTNPIRKSQPAIDPYEKVRFRFMGIKDVLGMVTRGEFKQALHVCSLFLALNKVGRIKLRPQGQ